MINYLDTPISVFDNVFAAEKSQVCRLRDFLCKDGIKHQIDAIRKESDKAKRDAMKRQLPVATISGVFARGHSASDMVEHSGLMCIDVDAQDNPHINDWEAFKKQVGQLPYVLYAGLSSSGRGVFVIMRIPKCDAKKHGLFFDLLQKAFARCGVTIDSHCRDVNRLRFASYDDNAYINENAEVYSTLPPVPKRLPKHAQMRSNAIIDTRTTIGKVEECVRLVCAHKIDMTNSYDEWLRLGMALADLGESGRTFFHDISQWNAKYTPEECDAKFSQLLRTRRGAVNIGTFFHICADHGIKPMPPTGKKQTITREPSPATVATWRRMLAEGSRAACISHTHIPPT